MTVWFTSDLHLLHPKVAGLRGFQSAEEHDEVLRRNWTAQVKDGDSVWVLGDVQISCIDYALDFVSSLPGIKHLVAGNHDPCHPMHRSAHKFQKKYLTAFDSIQAYARRRLCGMHVLLSHFPYQDDHTEVARYTQYRLRDEGRWLLHGHTHSTERLHGHEIHVGLDAWDMKLVSIDTIANIIKEESKDAKHSDSRRT